MYLAFAMFQACASYYMLLRSPKQLIYYLFVGIPHPPISHHFMTIDNLLELRSSVFHLSNKDNQNLQGFWDNSGNGRSI
jgi:hypothetical protein